MLPQDADGLAIGKLLANHGWDINDYEDGRNLLEKGLKELNTIDFALKLGVNISGPFKALTSSGAFLSHLIIQAT